MLQVGSGSGFGLVVEGGVEQIVVLVPGVILPAPPGLEQIPLPAIVGRPGVGVTEWALLLRG